MSVKSEAQSVLRRGWPVLLPSALERVIALKAALDEEGTFQQVL